MINNIKQGSKHLIQHEKSSLMIVAGSMLFLISLAQFNFLLYHTLVELFSVVIAFSFITLIWSNRYTITDRSLLFLGIMFIPIAGIDLIHTLTYKGVGIFPGNTANQATQLWIAARYTEAFVFLLFPLFIRRRLRPLNLTIAAFFILFALLFSIMISDIFPTCFIEGSGLTAFKKISEYVISLILLGSLVMMNHYKRDFNPILIQLSSLAILMTIISELSFTFYVDVYGLSNHIGHIFKFIAFFLLYKAVLEISIRQPMSSLFRELKERETALRHEKDQLLKAQSEIKVLSGMLPICSHCKKIRDDQGYWQRVDVYIKEHADVNFSHGLCPDCAHELYPEFFPKEKSETLTDDK